jgi:Ribose/xylose/arabinose/galactoside ABC-type transport systems, permease components
MKLPINRKFIPIAATIIVALILYFAVGLRYTGFISLRVFVNFFIDNAFLGIIAVGMTFVIISGGIDLSVGSMVAFTGVLTAFLIEKQHVHPLLAIASSLLLGALIGFLMGCMIHYFKAAPFIVTLTGMFFCRGLANMISLESIPINNSFFRQLTGLGVYLPGRINVPAIVFIFLIVFIIGIYLAHFTKFGRNVYALGGSSQSALLMGLPIGRTKLLIYTMSGFLSALAGIVFAMYTSAGYGLSGVGLEMDAIASVVIGGTLLTGGVGYIAGTLIGVLIQGIIQTFITFDGTLNSWWAKIAIGLLLLMFILLQRAFVQTSERTKTSEAVFDKTKEEQATI